MSPEIQLEAEVTSLKYSKQLLHPEVVVGGQKPSTE